MPWHSGFVRSRQHADKAYRADELAEVFGVTRQTIYLLAKKGTLPSNKIGRRTLLFPKVAINRMLKAGFALKL